MNHSKFQLYKVKLFIRTHGRTLNFERPKKNSFGEPTDTAETVTVQGVYHESVGYISRTTSEGSQTRTKSSPMILVTWEDSSKLQLRDKLSMNNILYEITGIKDVGESNVVSEVSLEAVLDGK